MRRSYPLATLVAIRERREQDAALELSRREQVLANAEEASRRQLGGIGFLPSMAARRGGPTMEAFSGEGLSKEGFGCLS